jgi:hypothetical protein
MTDAPFIIFTYNVVALSGVVIIIYVMQTVENDRIGRIDPYIVMQLRRLAFTGTALALCYSVISDDWHRSLPILLLVSAGVLNLFVNAVSLHMRRPPSPGSRSRNYAFHTPHFMARLVRYFSHR